MKVAVSFKFLKSLSVDFSPLLALDFMQFNIVGNIMSVLGYSDKCTHMKLHG